MEDQIKTSTAFSPFEVFLDKEETRLTVQFLTPSGKEISYTDNDFSDGAIEAEALFSGTNQGTVKDIFNTLITFWEAGREVSNYTILKVKFPDGTETEFWPKACDEKKIMFELDGSFCEINKLLQ